MFAVLWRVATCVALYCLCPLEAANAQWKPFGEGLGSYGSGPTPRQQRSNKPSPQTSGFVLISRQTVAGLDQAIINYEQIVRAGGWPSIPEGPRLKQGARDRRVAALRRRLQMTGELTRGSANSDRFDGDVHDAVIRFQERNGLTPSGEVNRFTLRALNVSAQRRLEQLRLNRSRLRGLLKKTGNRPYIVVNIPGYELQAVSGGQLALTSRVVVGKPSTPTPEIDASVRAVNFLPYWHVPQSIARRALIPAAKKDPNYLVKEHIRVYASWGGTELDPHSVNWWAPQGQKYAFRQDPGPFNALGLIRLDIPNRHIVYMHDTPLKKLFGYYLRPYSAGCVRVEQVQALAGWLLSNEPGWGTGAVERALQAGQQQTVKLSRPVPVHFVYVTAWTTPDGQAQFRMDIYDKDKTDGQEARTAKWETGSSSIAP